MKPDPLLDQFLDDMVGNDADLNVVVEEIKRERREREKGRGDGYEMGREIRRSVVAHRKGRR